MFKVVALTREASNWDVRFGIGSQSPTTPSWQGNEAIDERQFVAADRIFRSMHSGKANLPGCSFHRGATLTSFALMRLKRTRRYVVRHLTCPYNSMHASEMAAPSSSHREIGNPITYLIIRQPVAVIAAREIFSASPFPLNLVYAARST